MNVFLIFINILNAASYKLLSYSELNTTTITYYPCPSISPLLQRATIDVMKDLNDFNMFDFQLREQTKAEGLNYFNTICNKEIDGYGYCSHYPTYSSETDIVIANKILYYDTNLYNIVLHELLHSIGLDHTTDKGIMNNSVKVNEDYSIIRDNTQMYLSVDDYNGFSFVYDTLTKREIEIEKNMTCKKRKIIQLLRDCV
mgnify:CR=1 FL=1